MFKKAVNLALVLVFVFVVVTGTTLVNVAKANPWLIFAPIDPIPGTIPPTITILSPKSNTAYPDTTLNLTIHITKPQPPYPMDSGISYARYILDSNVTSIYFCDHYSSGSPPGIPELNYSQIISDLPDGAHELVIEVSGVVLPGNLTIFTMYTNATVFFTTGDTNFHSSPVSSTASSEPASTPNFIQAPFSAMLIIAAVLIVAAIGGILLLQHYKRSNR